MRSNNPERVANTATGQPRDGFIPQAVTLVPSGALTLAIPGGGGECAKIRGLQPGSGFREQVRLARTTASVMDAGLHQGPKSLAPRRGLSFEPPGITVR